MTEPAELNEEAHDEWEATRRGEAPPVRPTVPAPPKHYRDVLVALFQDAHHRPTADSVLNELHQHGWKMVPRGGS